MTELTPEQITGILGTLGLVSSALTKYFLDKRKTAVKKSNLTPEELEFITKLRDDFKNLETELSKYKTIKDDEDYEEDIEDVKSKSEMDKRITILEERIKTIKDDIIDVKNLISSYKESGSDEMKTIYKKLDDLTLILIQKIK